MNKKIIFTLSLIIVYFTCCNILPYNINNATKHLTENALPTSHNCCAWYVMRAMQSGGCPAIILPAWMYEYYLPLIGWKEITEKPYIPNKGDICVFPLNKRHIFGHIAMYNGEQWISDFKQKNIIVSKDYKSYKIYKHRLQ